MTVKEFSLGKEKKHKPVYEVKRKGEEIVVGQNFTWKILKAKN